MKYICYVLGALSLALVGLNYQMYQRFSELKRENRFLEAYLREERPIALKEFLQKHQSVRRVYPTPGGIDILATESYLVDYVYYDRNNKYDVAILKNDQMYKFRVAFPIEYVSRGDTVWWDVKDEVNTLHREPQAEFISKLWK